MWIEIVGVGGTPEDRYVTPCAGVWIEIAETACYGAEPTVTPCAGVWIEMDCLSWPQNNIPSLPVRECGLKCAEPGVVIEIDHVTPCAGVWIEINRANATYARYGVTPCAGVWIEIVTGRDIHQKSRSLPARECGLKYSSLPPA